jgi:pantoate--beta-alanine ligase
MQRVVGPSEMAALAARWRAEGRRVGFVPTMGYLHRGHTSLMALARPRVDVLVVSIYVNPLQFGPHEDLARYPRDLPGDLAACDAAGVDVVFTPESLYPPGFQTTVSVSSLATRWEGAARPGHFDGVATVVARLFGLVQPTMAVFGEKDFQQLAVLRAMVRDLALPVEIVAGPLVRDEDGVALSSRNAYLSGPERARARTLSRALAAMVGGPADVAARVAAGRAILDCDALEYLAIVDPDTLEPMATVDRPAQAIAVARYGSVRLLDNRAVSP